jgi:hypothetical protein
MEEWNGGISENRSYGKNKKKAPQSVFLCFTNTPALRYSNCPVLMAEAVRLSLKLF